MEDSQPEGPSPDGDGSGSGSGSVRCLICLNTFSGQPVATPQQCDHHYCLTCVTSTSCPVDRLEFNVVYGRRGVGGDIIKTVDLPQCSVSGEEAAEDLSVCEECGRSVCEECGRSDRRNRMLICSACDSRFHIGCLTPPLSSVPVGDWLCQDCADEGRLSEESDDDINEDEISDLLSETVPTSRRLRPSTTQPPPIPSRHSTRVPPRSSTRVPPRSSTTLQHVPRYLLKSSRPDDEDTSTSALLLNTAESDQPIRRKKKRR
ncbi:PHD and RING finger domain-containing protein 1-like [Astyanax mexicanus]|uniref:PHD and RING finger domain-containing protein 1-like n=1 Tax=Astyanax mexicanus TaxID=7994 RepID=A0A8T2KQ83_ASTMX|nr:PHD and RING finger domain-containing protein 1-like [Astyanax mexicanus]